MAAKEDRLVDLGTTALFCYCILRDVRRSLLRPHEESRTILQVKEFAVNNSWCYC